MFLVCPYKLSVFGFVVVFVMSIGFVANVKCVLNCIEGVVGVVCAMLLLLLVFVKCPIGTDWLDGCCNRFVVAIDSGVRAEEIEEVEVEVACWNCCCCCCCC